MIGYQKILCIVFIALAIVVLFLGVRFGLWQFSDLTPYILAPIFASIAAAILFIFKPSPVNQTSQPQPQLRYNTKQIRVKSWEDYTFDKKFHYSEYYLTIENTGCGIEARECKGKITVSDIGIERQQMLWESGKPNIAIGHEELLRLFKVSESSERKSILFYRNPLEYNEGMNEEKIFVKIQSENAECPTDAYEAKVGDVIKKAR